jgi:tetratricopeptide (TPR) repeat protein
VHITKYFRANDYCYAEHLNMKTTRLRILLFFVLFASIANAQTEEIYYFPKLPQSGISEAKTNLADILMETGNLNHPKLIHINGYGNPRVVSVFEDRFEMMVNPQNITYYFSDLCNYTIQIIQIKHPATTNYEAYSNFEIRLGKLEFFIQRNFSEASFLNFKKLADYLFYFQHQANIKLYDSLLVQFKPIAAQYSALKAKPTVSEEQRKYIVQANGYNELKNYTKAIELYRKAVETDQTAYPAAFSNLALLSAQLNESDAAIYYMKKYLMLEPDATDARNALDKIYLWEARQG